MDVTRVVFHFEMSALNASALANTAGVHVNAVAVGPEQEKKENPKLSENHKSSWNKQLNKKTREGEVGRTVCHVRHPSRVPL